ncbi:hypothetical protein CFP75_02065 [Amycolatopsis alba DSM 44262]|uniref:Uncharacterized protein n=1 Tax=Amycolatopsis alba DSM 44262 TaxID=1125972 RepID=A0A229S7N6_AMYAL|nr:hypothetical protein [Amycolatopsis alba]OXM54947.1 hypothetical protein CFP75_02065 [Amycolatopsis alba DSM 44262]
MTGAGLGVAINLATELKGNALAWVAVAILTATSAAIGYTADKTVQRKRAGNRKSPTGSPGGTSLTSQDNRGTIIQNSGSSIDSFHVTSDSRTTLWLSLNLTVLCLTVVTLVVVPQATHIGAAAPAAPSTSDSAKPAPKDPVSLTVESVATSCTWYGTSRPVTQVGAPPQRGDMNADYAAWAQDNDVAEIGWSKVLVTVKSTSEKPVSITGIDFLVSERKPVIKGATLGGGCGSETTARFAVVDLDQNPPRITESTSKELTWGDENWRTSPLRFPYTVSDKETESLLLIAKTDACECRWKARLRWSNGETTGSSVLDYKGKPFHTSGSAGLRDSYIYNDTAKQWDKL